MSSDLTGSIMTVRGAVSPQDLGVTLPHEHLLWNIYWAQARWDINGILRDVDQACDEVAHFRKNGGGTIVETSVPGSGRDPLGLRTISERTDVHVVMGCGWYRQPYYRPEDRIDRRSPDDLAAEIVHEFESGVADTEIRPGIIGEIGCDKTWMSALEERAHRAAARAQLATGLAITTHAIASPVGLWQLNIFEEEGVDLSRVAVGHADSYPVLDYYKEIARRGAFVQFDKVGDPRSFFMPEARLVVFIQELVAAGYLEHILLSHDTAFPIHLKVLGGIGYDYVPTVFRQRLDDAGLSSREIEQILVDNPRRLLTIG